MIQKAHLTRSDILHTRTLAVRFSGAMLIEVVEGRGPDVNGDVVVINGADRQPDGTFEVEIVKVVPGAGPNYGTLPAGLE